MILTLSSPTPERVVLAIENDGVAPDTYRVAIERWRVDPGPGNMARIAESDGWIVGMTRELQPGETGEIVLAHTGYRRDVRRGPRTADERAGRAPRPTGPSGNHEVTLYVTGRIARHPAIGDRLLVQRYKDDDNYMPARIARLVLDVTGASDAQQIEVCVGLAHRAEHVLRGGPGPIQRPVIWCGVRGDPDVDTLLSAAQSRRAG